MDETPEGRDLRESRAKTFGGVAEVYDGGRPDYPERATRWLVGREPSHVLELGAGTGKLTGGLVGLGHDVVATDPSLPMLQRLADGTGVACVRTAAEELPFSSNTFDTVVVAQALHWFDLDRALPEIARVLREDGELALVWNLRDESIPWTRRLTTIIGSESHDLDRYANELPRSGLFSVPESKRFGFWESLDREGLLGMVRSRSYVAALDEVERASVMRQVGELFEEHAKGTNGLQLRYATHCFRARVDKSALPGEVEPPGGGDLLFDFR